MNRLNTLLIFGMLFVAMSIGYMINDALKFRNDPERLSAHYQERMERECYGDHYELCMEYYQKVIDGLAQTK